MGAGMRSAALADHASLSPRSVWCAHRFGAIVVSTGIFAAAAMSANGTPLD